MITLRLDAMAHGGDAVGRADGRAVFVRGGVPGDLVQVVLTEQRARFARGRVAAVLEPSPARTAPRCPHFGFEAGACGGCQWQHVDYQEQLRWKTQIVREQLRRIGGFADPPVHDAVPSRDAWGYRNNAQVRAADDGGPGFLAARTRQVVPIRECHVVQAPIARWIALHSGVVGERVELRCGSDGRLVASSDARPEPTTHVVRGVPFVVSNDSFFQVNAAMVDTLVSLVLDALALSGGETVVDAYCGVGLFARFVAERAARVIAIEGSPAAVADARTNLAGFAHVELREGAVEVVLTGITERVDALVADPPRAGLAPSSVAWLVAHPPRVLVYVSCDPATLARDARLLADGGYALREVRPLDLFPQTWHCEAVALFEQPA